MGNIVIAAFLSANLALIQSSAALVVGKAQAPDYLGAAWVHLMEAGDRRLAAGKVLDVTWLKYSTTDAVKAAVREEKGQYKTKDAEGKTVTVYRADASTFSSLNLPDAVVDRATPLSAFAGSYRDREASHKRATRAGESEEQKADRLAKRRAKYAQRAHSCPTIRSEAL